MTSGVKVSDDVIKVYDQIRLHHSGEDVQEHLKFVRFKVDGSFIVVDKDCMLKVKDLKGEEDVFNKIVGLLPLKECCYALYDCCYTTHDSPKDDLVFIMWAPEDAAVKDRLLYASSKGAIKKALSGAKYEWQLNDVETSRDVNSLLEKLQAKGDIKLLEGKEVQCARHK